QPDPLDNPLDRRAISAGRKRQAGRRLTVVIRLVSTIPISAQSPCDSRKFRCIDGLCEAVLSRWQTGSELAGKQDRGAARFALLAVPDTKHHGSDFTVCSRHSEVLLRGPFEAHGAEP